jgi:hypothetical protein
VEKVLRGVNFGELTPKCIFRSNDTEVYALE